MKLDKHAKDMRGKSVNITTSGGGKFDGYAGNYDRESNTIDVWKGIKRTRVDADKIVSVNVVSPLWALLVIAIFVVGCFLLLDITKPSNRGYRSYDRYDNYDRYDRYDRDVIPYRNYDQYRKW